MTQSRKLFFWFLTQKSLLEGGAELIAVTQERPKPYNLWHSMRSREKKPLSHGLQM